jgi:hypothetical protein
MKLYQTIKSYPFVSILILLIIVGLVFYFVKRNNEGIPTDSNLVTTKNPYLIPPESVLGKTNTLVMQWKDDINARMGVVNAMFDSNGVLKPASVTILQEGIIQLSRTANPALSVPQIKSMVTPDLLKTNLKKDNIKIFLDNLIDLATIIKQALN